MENREQVPHPHSPTEDGAPLVLIADDEAPIAEVLAMLVEDAGYIPAVALNGRQALDLAHVRWPALVITDLMMPHLNGSGLIAALRAQAAVDHHRMPAVIVLTAGGMAEARSTGADAVVRKPFDIAKLEGLIAQLLSR